MYDGRSSPFVCQFVIQIILADSVGQGLPARGHICVLYIYICVCVCVCACVRACVYVDRQYKNYTLIWELGIPLIVIFTRAARKPAHCNVCGP